MKNHTITCEQLANGEYIPTLFKLNSGKTKASLKMSSVNANLYRADLGIEYNGTMVGVRIRIPTDELSAATIEGARDKLAWLIIGSVCDSLDDQALAGAITKDIVDSGIVTVPLGVSDIFSKYDVSGGVVGETHPTTITG